jgi:hypothetical protein
MSIPEAQLETWSKQGSVTQSRDTYATVRAALEAPGPPNINKNFSIFLQGSYANDTNVYAESDVDVVMLLNSTFYHDLEDLQESQKQAFHLHYANASYGPAEFNSDVTAWLKQKFGNAVQSGSKAIFIQGNGSRRDTDVVVATQYRRYYSFQSSQTQSYTEGICFFASDGTKIINYPKQHSENCTAKHQGTSSWFKPTVRILKNMRNRMVADKLIEDGLAPSYYLEGLFYNVPKEQFGSSYQDTFVNCFNWILNADRSKFLCANEQYYLLREGSPVTWRADKCNQFLNALSEFWKQW